MADLIAIGYAGTTTAGQAMDDIVRAKGLVVQQVTSPRSRSTATSTSARSRTSSTGSSTAHSGDVSDEGGG
jgi:hypothetical protein